MKVPHKRIILLISPYLIFNCKSLKHIRQLIIMELSFWMEMSAGANDDVIIVIIIIG